ncbi:hypothetical protein ACFJGW_13190 [Burkholderiaceae bacterium UC74_6]
MNKSPIAALLTAPLRKSLGLPEQGFVFCCFNSPCKLSAETLAAWASILSAVPGSVLWLLDDEDEPPAKLRERARGLGLDPQRLVFAAPTSREAYLANFAAADLFLDTLPHNTGTTAGDAFWMGLPVLTLTQMGHPLPARMAASLLEAAALPELIARDADEYVALAIGLAAVPARLNALRRRLVSSSSTQRLFDAPTFSRSLEAAFQRAQALALSTRIDH